MADATLLKDRGIKAAIYAAADVPEYWLINLADGLIEAHRHPVAGRYAHVESIGTAGLAVPAAFPSFRISPAELLS